MFINVKGLENEKKQSTLKKCVDFINKDLWINSILQASGNKSKILSQI